MFDQGRIYYSKATGAHELFGPMLAGYRRLGGPVSRLGFPTTGVQARRDGFRTKFQGGVVYTNPGTGTCSAAGSGRTWAGPPRPTSTSPADSG